MNTKEAITLFKYYLRSNHKIRAIESYRILLDRFNAIHAERLLDDISPDEIFHFLEDLTRSLAKSTRRQQDRLILELQALCGLRIGELLKIRVTDVSDRTITLREPKSGKEAERAYMPENVSRKLVEYIKENARQGEKRIFPICYSTARLLVRRLGEN
jgi:integrase